MKVHLKNLTYLLIVQCGNYIFPIITIPIVARALGPDLIGVYSFITAIVAYFTLLVTYSFNYTGVRRLSSNPDSINSIFNAVVFSKLFLCIFSLLLFYIIILSYSMLQNYKFASWLCFVSVVSCIFQNNWLFQFKGDYKFITFISVFTKVLSSTLIIFFVRDRDDFLYYISFVQGAILSGNLIGYFYTLKKYNLKVVLPDIIKVKSFIIGDSYIFASSVLANLYTTSSIVLLGFFCSSKDVGYYSSAQKIIDLVKNFSVLPLNMLIFPAISKRLSVSIDSGLELFAKFLPFFVLTAIVSSLGILIFGGYVISIFFGPEFSASIPLLKILSLGYFSVFFGVIIGGQVVLGLKMDKQFVIIQSVVAAFSLFCNFFLLPRGGALSTAWVWSLSELIMLVFQIAILKFYKVKFYDLKYFQPSEMLTTIRSLMSK